MACEFEVFLNLNQYNEAAEATLSAFELVDELDQQLSVYRDDSELSRLNRSTEKVVPVSDVLWGLLTLAETIHRETKGAFDHSSTPLSKAWGFFQREGAVPDADTLKDAMQKVDASKIRLHKSAVEFLDDQLEINLNSIGKGYALDRAASQMVAFGVLDFIIHGGQSSVIARGNETTPEVLADPSTQAGSGWNVGLSHPYVPNRRLVEIVLDNQSLSTSGTARQGFYHQGRRYGHVIDPRTGWPTDHLLSATVVCNSAAQSDALATSFFVMSLDEIQAYCDDHPEVAAILVVPGTRSGAVRIEQFNVPDAMVTLF